MPASDCAAATVRPGPRPRDPITVSVVTNILSIPQAATAAKNQSPKETSLLGLPAELRLKIYEYLTPDEEEKDSDVFNIELKCYPYAWISSPYRICSDVTQEIVCTFGWIFTCRKMFNEGFPEILKTHVIGFPSEKCFSDLYIDGHLKTVRRMEFWGFELPEHALKYAKRLDDGLLKDLEEVWVQMPGRWRRRVRISAVSCRTLRTAHSCVTMRPVMPSDLSNRKVSAVLEILVDRPQLSEAMRLKMLSTLSGDTSFFHKDMLPGQIQITTPDSQAHLHRNPRLAILKPSQTTITQQSPSTFQKTLHPQPIDHDNTLAYGQTPAQPDALIDIFAAQCFLQR